jgi:hypothetical protein
MANLFDVNIETPQETQRRILEEQLAKQKTLGPQSAAGQVGSAIGKALSNMFGAEAKQMKKADFAQKATAAGATVQQQLVKQGVSEFDAGLQARAHTIAVLRDKGDHSTADAIQANTTNWIAQQKKEQMEIDRVKAATASSEQQVTESKQRTFLSKTEAQVQSELSQLNRRMGEFPDGVERGPAYQKMLERQQNLSSRLIELREEDEKAKQWALTDRQVIGEDGNTYTQRVAVNKEDPTEIIEIGDPIPEPFKMSSAAEKRLHKYNTAYRTSQQSLVELRTLDEGLETLDDAGALATMNERAKELTGTQDAESYTRIRLQAMRVSDAIKNLPPGVASDKDIELVMSGTIPPNASYPVLKEYLAAMQRVQEAAGRYNKFAANHVSENGNERGLIPAWDEAEAEYNEVNEANVQAKQNEARQAQDQLAQAQQAATQEIIRIQTALNDPNLTPQQRAALQTDLANIAQTSTQIREAQRNVNAQAGQAEPASAEDEMLNDILRR